LGFYARSLSKTLGKLGAFLKTVSSVVHNNNNDREEKKTKGVEGPSDWKEGSLKK